MSFMDKAEAVIELLIWVGLGFVVAGAAVLAVVL